LGIWTRDQYHTRNRRGHSITTPPPLPVAILFIYQTRIGYIWIHTLCRMYGFIGHRVHEFILFNVWIHIWRRDVWAAAISLVALHCHRPWYIGGNISRWISRFAKIALRLCKRWQTVTQIFRHIITDDDRRQIPHVVRRTTYYTAFQCGIATSSYPKDIKRYHLGICVIILDHTVGI